MQVTGGAVHVAVPTGPAGTRDALARREPCASKPPRATPAAARHVVIIGAGAAGVAAAETLRAEGFEGTITLLSREAVEPYDRTKLSKNLSYQHDDAALRPAGWFAKQRIALRLGVRAKAVDTGARVVTLEGGEALQYDWLLCASGGPARTLRADLKESCGETFTTPGAELPGVLALRTLADSAALQELATAAVEKGAPIVVIGTSFSEWREKARHPASHQKDQAHPHPPPLPP